MRDKTCSQVSLTWYWPIGDFFILPKDRGMLWMTIATYVRDVMMVVE